MHATDNSQEPPSRSKAGPRRKWLWAMALASALLYWVADHGSKTAARPETENSGGSFRKTKTGADEGAGIKSITLHLDNDRANRLNARRNPYLLEAAPKAFGPENPFKPLVTAVATGPGNLEMTGNGPTGKTRTHVPQGTYEIEIYPEFIGSKLFSGEAGETETLKFYFEPATGGRDLQAEETLTWSGPTELFLSTKNLIDLAALTKRTAEAEAKTKPAPGPEAWLETLGKELAAEGLFYESEPSGQGWQPIRTLKKMREDKAANCLDIALLTAQRAKAEGFSPHILANSGHALCAVAPKGGGIETATFFEGTAYLSQEPKPAPTPIPGSLREKWEEIVPPGPTPEPTPAPNKAAPRQPEAEETFSIDLGHWEQFFRAQTPKEEKN